MQVRRLKEFGVTHGELTRYLDALLKDSEHLAAMIDNVPSVDNLDFIMESDALGHKVMDQRQGHESLLAVAGTVTLEEVVSFPVIGPCAFSSLKNFYFDLAGYYFIINDITNKSFILCKFLFVGITSGLVVRHTSSILRDFFF